MNPYKEGTASWFEHERKDVESQKHELAKERLAFEKQLDRRDRFAAAALTGLLSSGALPDRGSDVPIVAAASVHLADFLIAALDKSKAADCDVCGLRSGTRKAWVAGIETWACEQCIQGSGDGP